MIKIQDLVVRYGDNTAVQGLSLEVQAGQVLALLGPSCAGKSSTVRCLVGLQIPTAGQLSIAGHDLIHECEAARKALGYIPEQGHLYEVLTPRETLLLRGRLFGLQDELTHARGSHLCEALEILDRIDDPISGFSKGMRQKVVLAVALLSDPQVLVLDEPLSGLDAETTQLVKALLQELTRRGRAILYCSHLLDIVEKIADEIVILNDGAKVAEGSLDELQAMDEVAGHPSLESIFRRLTSAADPLERAQQLLDLPKLP
jgi:ABC-2 type transport system ATP-binding protein